ncbi:putative ring box protein 1 [Aduncisulcus paluster]|uniref:Ring box protein 1 n=1 Tax=Aduncisulcus paluster TaxID=2918883 RepID=A0ABQ5KIJ5_9EUKA|nr:putative ring box protein 1 [Aduncisulcus paluster]
MSKEDKPTFEIKAWHAVATWEYDIDVSTCAICQHSCMEPCIECQGKAGSASRCPLAWGECGHAFHFHCIDQWVKSKPKCPLCMQQWKMKDKE